jgi:DNA-binding CsgD family transcriptional regulator/PAS domain-containing protein
MPSVMEMDALIGRAYDCVLEPDGWDELLESCARLVGGESGVVYVKPRASTVGSLLTSRDFDRSYNLASYLSYYEKLSPLIRLYRHQPEGRATALGDYAFSADYRETEFFQDWVRPQKFADMLGSHLVRAPELTAWMSIRRSERRGIYSKPEIHTAARLFSHLGRIIKLRFRFEMECRLADGLRGALERVEFGVLIVDARSKILMGNRAADAILQAGDGLKCHGGRLTCDRQKDASALEEAIFAVTAPAKSRQRVPLDFPIRRSVVHRPLTAHILPIPTKSAWKGFSPQSGVAAVFVIDPLVRSADVSTFAEAYYLTTAERGLLREVVQGGGVVDAAGKLGISVPTARTHLQHIFEKTTVNSQVELVRLIMNSCLQFRSRLSSD